MAKKTFAIIGANDFGISIARELLKRKCEVSIFDIKQANIDNIKDTFPNANINAVCVDVRTNNFVETYGLQYLDGVFLTISNDLETGILIASTLQDFKVENLFIKVVNDKHKKILKKMNFSDENIIYWNEEISSLIVNHAYYKLKNTNIHFLDNDCAVITILLGSQWINKSFTDLNLVRKNLTVLQVIRKNNVLDPVNVPNILFEFVIIY